MPGPDYYYIMAFQTTTDAVQAEISAKKTVSASLMPVPREISSGCGLALRFMEDNEEKILAYLKDSSLKGTLYKMYKEKVDGRHPIEQLGTG